MGTTTSEEIFPSTNVELKGQLTRTRKYNIPFDVNLNSTNKIYDEYHLALPLTQEHIEVFRKVHLLSNQHLINENGDLPPSAIRTQTTFGLSERDKLYFVLKEFLPEVNKTSINEKLDVLDGFVEQGKAVKIPEMRNIKTTLHQQMTLEILRTYDSDSDYVKVHIIT